MLTKFKVLLPIIVATLSIASISWAGTFRPYAEYERSKYLIITDPFVELVPYLRTLKIPGHNFEDHDRASYMMKTQIIRNLPLDVTLVILYTDNSFSHKLKLGQYLLAVMGQRASSVKLLYKDKVTTGKEQLGLFWARDSFPLVLKSDGGRYVLADIKFEKPYKYAEPDRVVSDFLRKPTVDATKRMLEGGNFLATATGICFSVVSEFTDEAFFKTSFGCKKVYLMPNVGGIGHIDERIKIVTDRQILTDSIEYLKILSRLGFEVTLLPKAPGGKWRTYLNSLLINNTAFVPSYGSKIDDEKVLNIYRKLNFKVVSIDSRLLSDQGAGSIHCFTVTYPAF